MQSSVVSTRGTPAAGHPARRGSDPLIANVRPQMKTIRSTMALLLLTGLTGCWSVPRYIRDASHVRLILPDQSNTCELNEAETSELVKVLDGRLFTAGIRVDESTLKSKQCVLLVRYPYASSEIVVTDAKGQERDRVKMGPGATVLAVYADGTVGYMRSIVSSEFYPMERYCEKALQFAEKHGIIIK